MARITKDMIISDIIDIHMGCIPILLSEGMHCVGCPSAQGESLEEACLVHGLDADALAKKLNDFVKTSKNRRRTTIDELVQKKNNFKKIIAKK